MPANGHICKPENLAEIGLSNCDAGCKIMACPDCGAEYIEHSAVYGCHRTREDYFRPVEGPSLAATYRQWLDRGMPSHTWSNYVDEWRACGGRS